MKSMGVLLSLLALALSLTEAEAGALMKDDLVKPRSVAKGQLVEEESNHEYEVDTGDSEDEEDADEEDEDYLGEDDESEVVEGRITLKPKPAGGEDPLKKVEDTFKKIETISESQELKTAIADVKKIMDMEAQIESLVKKVISDPKMIQGMIDQLLQEQQLPTLAEIKTIMACLRPPVPGRLFGKLAGGDLAEQIVKLIKDPLNQAMLESLKTGKCRASVQQLDYNCQGPGLTMAAAMPMVGGMVTRACATVSAANAKIDKIFDKAERLQKMAIMAKQIADLAQSTDFRKQLENDVSSTAHAYVNSQVSQAKQQATTHFSDTISAVVNGVAGSVSAASSQGLEGQVKQASATLTAQYNAMAQALSPSNAKAALQAQATSSYDAAKIQAREQIGDTVAAIHAQAKAAAEAKPDDA